MGTYWFEFEINCNLAEQVPRRPWLPEPVHKRNDEAVPTDAGRGIGVLDLE